jgi:hypothetical protein
LRPSTALNLSYSEPTVETFQLEEETFQLEENEMEVANIQILARQLYEAQGPKAIAEAAQKAAAHEKRGEADEAATWRRIEAALLLLRGPRET